MTRNFQTIHIGTNAREDRRKVSATISKWMRSVKLLRTTAASTVLVIKTRFVVPCMRIATLVAKNSPTISYRGNIN